MTSAPSSDFTRDTLFKKASEIHRRISECIGDMLPNRVGHRLITGKSKGLDPYRLLTSWAFIDDGSAARWAFEIGELDSWDGEHEPPADQLDYDVEIETITSRGKLYPKSITVRVNPVDLPESVASATIPASSYPAGIRDLLSGLFDRVDTIAASSPKSGKTEENPS